LEPATQTPPTVENPGLARRLGLFDATMLVMGGIIGSGIFVNPSVVAKVVKTPGVILGAWAVGGLIALAGSFIYAELAALRPHVGGQYAYIREAFHPGIAFVYGWTLLLVSQTGGMAAVAITFGRYLIELTRLPVSDWVVAVITLAVLTLINCFGVRAGSTVQSVLMVLKILAILMLIVVGLTVGEAAPVANLSQASAQSGFASQVSGFGAALVPVLFAYGGWQTATFVAGEIREPRKNLPRGLLLGVAGVIVLYISVSFVCLSRLGVEGLAATDTPASAVMRLALGERGARLIAVGIAISTVGFLSQSILTAPRVYFAMADDRLFFKSVARLHPVTRVPVVAIVLQGVFAIVIATLSGRYEGILNYVVSVDSIFFAMTGAALLVLRRVKMRGEENDCSSETGFDFKVPAVFIVSFVLIECFVGLNTIYKYPQNSAISVAIMLAGIPVYLFWRHRGKRG